MWREIAALQDSNLAYDRLGSKAERLAASIFRPDWLQSGSSGPAIKWIADLPLRIVPIASPCRPLARQWWEVVCLARTQE